MWRALPLLVLPLAAQQSQETFSAWPVDALVKVFPDDPPGKSRAAPQAWPVARNGHASLQFAIRSQARIPALSAAVSGPERLRLQVRRVGYVPVGSNPPRTPYDEVVRPAPALFPDPLFEDFPFALEPGRTEPIWITAYAPPETPPGEYAGQVRFLAGGKLLATAAFRIRVASATVPPRQSLKVTNWFSLGEGGLARFYRVEGERYWELLENIGRVMAEHRQNVILTPVLSLTDVSVKDGALAYGFARLDRWVAAFEKAGLIGTIEGGHLLSRASGYQSPLVVPAWVVEAGQAVQKRLEPDDPRAPAFFDSFLTALYAHLKRMFTSDDLR